MRVANILEDLIQSGSNYSELKTCKKFKHEKFTYNFTMPDDDNDNEKKKITLRGSGSNFNRYMTQTKKSKKTSDKSAFPN